MFNASMYCYVFFGSSNNHNYYFTRRTHTHSTHNTSICPIRWLLFFAVDSAAIFFSSFLSTYAGINHTNCGGMAPMAMPSSLLYVIIIRTDGCCISTISKYSNNFTCAMCAFGLCQVLSCVQGSDETTDIICLA